MSLETDENLVLDYIEAYIGNEGDEIDGEKCDIIFMANGRFVSYKEIEVVYCTPSAKERIRYGKLNGKLPIDVEIFMEDYSSCLQIYTDSSRATSPYFVVNPETKELVIEEINGWNLSYDQLIFSGAVE